MKNIASNPDIVKKPIDLQLNYSKCEDLKTELMFYSKDLRFLQQLLDRYFDEMVQNENLDEMRESLMRFQDLCYNCDRLKKRVKDQQKRLIDLMKGEKSLSHEALLLEQSSIEKSKTSLMGDFKMVKKEILTIADHVLQVKKDNESFSYNS
ncbi:hypothetical protein [Maribacter sp. HTCC2170]|uniref:hypothetical protein n=1 Tax=Maribacter sp. (strain HTCC2170 / KCCM 42371) TaxID=313603 RepID=UPI00006B485C|nr:hypothetical protein [Maribacter sp. HTCC2170]EAR01747.1 hypothetical protein FB2170_14503 [Maribacter sp. HTCC2170]